MKIFQNSEQHEIILMLNVFRMPMIDECSGCCHCWVPPLVWPRLLGSSESTAIPSILATNLTLFLQSVYGLQVILPKRGMEIWRQMEKRSRHQLKQISWDSFLCRIFQQILRKMFNFKLETRFVLLKIVHFYHLIKNFT